ncbi:MAG TPA: hypothetical protein DCE78_02290 [Bacteroidetes bacterium]|nr:hypothetical protein [Bacteroidota bacterium]
MIEFELVTLKGKPGPDIIRCWNNLLDQKNSECDRDFFTMVRLIEDELSNYNAKVSKNHLVFEDELYATMFILRWS